MSRFSEYLKKIIDESGESISSIARSAGIERTSIHKALSDERQLSYKSVMALVQHFQLSVEERQEFLQAYDILLQGEETWKNRKAICEMLNTFSLIHFEKDVKIQYSVDLTPANVSRGLAEGEYMVRNLIRSVLQEEIKGKTGAKIQMFLPGEMNLSMMLMDLWMDGCEFKIDQIYCFKTVLDRECAQNIELLQQIIPLSLVSRGGYCPYYFHERSMSTSINPFSYYIVTSQYLIQIRQDQSAAWIETSPDLIRHFSGHFQNLLEKCDLLVHCSSDIKEVLERFAKNASGKEFTFMMPQPCFGRYFTADVIRKYLRVPNEVPYQMIFDAAKKRFEALGTIEDNYYTIFTEKGLRDFAESGVLAEMPSEYVLPFEQEDRRRVLQSLRDEIMKGTVLGLIARPSVLRIPDYMGIYMDTMGRIHFDTMDSFIYGAYCCDIHISEKFICSAFLDFFQYLPKSQMVYSQEETLRILNEEIKKLSR